MVMGSSNLMMGLTLVLVVCLAVVLGLVLVLLAELYCSILLRRRHTTTTAAAVDNNGDTRSPSLTNLYAQSVIAAPRNILYPSVAGAGDDIEKQQQEFPQPPENQETGEHLVYISNPMYDGDENGRHSMVAGNTPFETPDTSPSRLETEETSSGDDDDDGEMEEEISSVKVTVTPPLSPMKKLPASVKDGGGDWNSNNGVSSTSSCGTPCTSSLSW
ncbi:hypothetical protein SSX86_008389 [Deinandra increscens subsp. villosa]|uniref:Uncharacterized protein n=1 Tax=Deinandra increscens subsp. villosa TaxID=3103831 RepID=A0AAP0DFC3_9ASTR